MDKNIDDLAAQIQALQIRVTQLEVEKQANASASPAAATSTTVHTGFRRGDRIRIRNALKKPATWPQNKQWDQQRAQLATVTHLKKGQVHFETDNGVKTWRAVQNLIRIE